MTNFRLAEHTGTEIYVRDYAFGLLARGHLPILYSPILGEVAREIRNVTIPVVDDLSLIATAPDIIHAHHHDEAMLSLIRFPGVPAVYVCHDWYADFDVPPVSARIRRYVGVDQTCCDRLQFRCGIPEDRIRLLTNGVDLERFRPRSRPLPARPQRALVFSNYVKDDANLAAVREGCARAGVTLDTLGLGTANQSAAPEKIISEYDIVFAKGRAALESLACGVAVIPYIARYVAPLVRERNYDSLLPLNFGRRAMRGPLAPEELANEIEKQIKSYDAADAASVTRRVREERGGEVAVTDLVKLYEEVIAEHAAAEPDPVTEGRETLMYFQQLQERFKNSSEHRLRERVLKTPVLGRAAKALKRRIFD